MTLTEFLLARIAEDEAVARAAADSDGERWAAAGLRYDDKFDASVVLDRSEVHVAHAEEPAAEHIARHDPARVLAECERDRRIVALHSGDMPICMDGYRPGLTHDGLLHSQSTNGVDDGYCDTIHALAAVYADHPDYRAEWRP